MTREELKTLVNQNIKTIDDESMSLLESLVDKTLEANEKFNLTAIKDKESFRELMVYDSLLHLKQFYSHLNQHILEVIKSHTPLIL